MNKLKIPVIIKICLSVSVATTLLSCSNQQVKKHEMAKEKAVESVLLDTSPEDRASILTEEMTRTLGLSQVQQQQVAGINLEYATKFSLLAASTNPGLDKKTRFLELLNEKDTALRQVLNNAQYQSWGDIKRSIVEDYRMM